LSNYYGHAPSSRPIRLQELDYAGSGTQVTTTLLNQVYQVRIVSDVRGYVSFGSTTITTSSRGVATVEIFPSLRGEYFSARPGETLSFSSSSTSSGSVLITECA
jgi:hypothetical protein